MGQEGAARDWVRCVSVKQITHFKNVEPASEADRAFWSPFKGFFSRPDRLTVL